jgi:hypothetical protein
VASHLKSFKDLNSLARTSRFFHMMFNPHLYRRAIAADRIVLDGIVGWVLSGHRLASLRLQCLVFIIMRFLQVMNILNEAEYGLLKNTQAVKSGLTMDPSVGG